MTVATIPTSIALLLLAAVLVASSDGECLASEVVSIWLTDGTKMTAEVHPRTNGEYLWLRFGDDRAVLLRGVAWERILESRIGDEPVTAAALRQMAAEAVDESEASLAAAPRPSSEPTYAEQARDLLGFSPRVTSVDFAAHLANWDADVEFDGIALRLFPLDGHGQVTPARGTLYVELVSSRSQDFNQVPNARGQVPTRLAQWTVAVDACEITENGVVVKLPFQTNHPEFDTTWAAHGLVHVRLVVPGHGVFEHSFDGLRVRPYAPLRDAMERQGGQRFLPTEQTGIGKRLP